MSTFEHLQIPYLHDDLEPLEHLLPADVVKAWREKQRLEEARADARRELGQAVEALAAAEKADAVAFAEAARAGRDDPGAVNATPARQRRAEAERRCRGYDEAVVTAGIELDRALKNRDDTAREAVEALELRAFAARERAEAAFDEAKRARDEYRRLRELAVWFANYPTRVTTHNEEDSWRQAREQLQRDLDAIAHAPSGV